MKLLRSLLLLGSVAAFGVGALPANAQEKSAPAAPNTGHPAEGSRHPDDRACLPGARFTPQQELRLLRHAARQHRHHAVRAHVHRRMAAWHDRHAGYGPGFAPGWPPRHDRHGLGRGKLLGPHGPGLGRDHGPLPGSRGGFHGIDLTDEQKSRVKALRKQQRAQIAESMNSFREQFRAILTPEQQQRLEARRGGNHPGRR